MKSIFGKIFTIFDRKEKIVFFTLSILIIVNTFLELLSIGLIIPIISIIFSPDILPDYLLEIEIIKDFIFSENFVGYLLSLMLVIYFLKNFLLGIIHIIQTNYIFGLQKRLSTKIFNNFLSKEYFFHLMNSRARLIQIVTGEVNNFVGRVISPIMILITEIFVSLGIILIVLMNDVNILNLIYFLTLILIIYYFYLKNKILKWGEDRRVGESNRIRLANETLQSIKEIKIFNKENFFLENFIFNNNKSVEASKKLTYLNILPRIITELIIISFLVFFLFFKLEQNINPERIIGTLAIFAAAAFRIMPSINRIMMSFQSLRFGIPVINPILKNYLLNSKLLYKEKKVNKIKFKGLLFQNVKFNYLDKKKLFNKLNFKINKNDKIQFIGQSGSGKTTLLNLIIGFLKPFRGKIYLNNKSLSFKDLFGWQQIIAYIPQRTCLINDTIINNIRLDSRIKVNSKKLLKCLKDSELIKDIKTNKISLRKKVGEDGVNLSEGQRQRLSIARALYHDRQILILDEATSSLDQNNQRKILNTISKLKDKTIIMVTHSTDNLKIFNKVFFMKNRNLYLKKNKYLKVRLL